MATQLTTYKLITHSKIVTSTSTWLHQSMAIKDKEKKLFVSPPRNYAAELKFLLTTLLLLCTIATLFHFIPSSFTISASDLRLCISRISQTPHITSASPHDIHLSSTSPSSSTLPSFIFTFFIQLPFNPNFPIEPKQPHTNFLFIQPSSLHPLPFYTYPFSSSTFRSQYLPMANQPFLRPNCTHAQRPPPRTPSTEQLFSTFLFHSKTSPHMSATALLQIAAQMGATVSNSNAGMVMSDKTIVATNMISPPPLFGMVQQPKIEPKIQRKGKTDATIQHLSSSSHRTSLSSSRKSYDRTSRTAPRICHRCPSHHICRSLARRPAHREENNRSAHATCETPSTYRRRTTLQPQPTSGHCDQHTTNLPSANFSTPATTSDQPRTCPLRDLGRHDCSYTQTLQSPAASTVKVQISFCFFYCSFSQFIVYRV